MGVAERTDDDGGDLMREYGRFSPQFWIGTTGRRLRGDMAAQLVAAYLLTSPHANMVGVYYLPVETIAHETGIPLEGASKALRRVCEEGFAAYDATAELVFVPGMARRQIADSMKVGDKRIDGVVNELMPFASHRFVAAFAERYRETFHLETAKKWEPLQRAIEGASKAPRSQEQEQEKEQKTEEPPPSKTEKTERQEKNSSANCRLPSVETKSKTEAALALEAPLVDPVEALVASYHELCPALPRVKILDADRRKKAATALTKRPLAEWREIYARAGRSAFLAGTNKRGWKAGFEWFFGRNDDGALNAVSVLEGMYDDRASQPAKARYQDFPHVA